MKFEPGMKLKHVKFTRAFKSFQYERADGRAGGDTLLSEMYVYKVNHAATSFNGPIG